MKICMDNSKQIIDAYMPLIKANARIFSCFDFEETVDESCMITIDAICEYDETKGSFGNFLKLKLRYHYLDMLKIPECESLDTFDELGNPLIDSVADDFDFTKVLEKNEEYARLYRAINELNATDRSIIVGKYFMEMSNDDLANKLGISYKTVANRSSLALKTLRTYLCN